MIKMYVFVILAFSALKASAIELSVSYQLTSSAKVSWSRVDKYRHSIDCYTFGKGDDSTPLPSETTSSSLTGATSSTATSDISSTVEPLSIGRLDLQVVPHKNSESGETFNVSLSDNITWSSYRNLGDGSCNLHEYHWRVNAHQVKGKYSLQIHMPADAYLLRLTIAPQGQGAPVLSQKIQGDLHGVAIKPNQEFYVWGIPGALIEIPFDINVSSGGGLIGQIALTIEQPGLVRGNDPAQDIQKSIIELSNAPNDRRITQQFINAGARILGHPKVATQIIESLGLSAINSVTAQLYKIAQGSTPNNPDDLHIKAVAAAVDYELALAILESLKVFCQDKVVYLPMTNVTVNRPGFIIANFWMNQSVQGISELHFPEVEAYLTGIKDWEQKGLTYADIAKDPKEYKKLSDAYIKIRRSSRFAFDVFGDLKATIQKITSAFGTIGTDPSKLSELYQRMDQLSADQKQLNHDFQQFVFGFVESNSSKIAAQALLLRVQNLSRAGSELSNRMNDVLKFYSIGQDGSEQNVLRTMTQLLSDEVGIFERPLKSQFIEPIRMVYQKLDQTALLQSAYNKCLGEKP